MRLVSVIAALACGAMVAPAAAQAATINVDATADEATNNGVCSLRDAVTAANTNNNAHESGCESGDAGTDTIQLTAGTFPLAGASGEDLNAGGDLDIEGNGPVVIQGAGIDANEQPTSTIDANNVDRALHVELDGGEAVNVQLLALGVRNGNTTDDGGGLLVSDPDADVGINTTIWQGNDTTDYGGAVHFADGVAGSSIFIEQSEFSGNTSGEEGGALWLDLPDGTDEATILNSAFVGNSASEMGGAIYLGTRAIDGIQLFLTNTTISGNSATLGGGALAFDLAEGGNAYFNFSTIANNTTATPGAAGGIQTVPPAGNDGQFVLLTRSIIAGNTAAGSPSNCVGPANYSGSGFSIESTNSCGLTPGNSMVNTDPLLAPLATSPGGEQSTRTHGLYDTSPAANFFAASMGACAGITFDQRYSPRPAGSGCDIGAFEGTVGPAPATPATPGTPATPAKKCKKKKKKKKRSLATAAKKKKKGCKKKKKKR